MSSNRFYLGQKITLTDCPPWYVRLWRWAWRRVTRYKPPVYVVTDVNREDGVITYTRYER